jgi:transposase
MELLTILNRCHRFRGFVYQYAHFSADKKSIEVAVRPRKGSVAVCSRCHLPAPGYDQLTERRFEFIPRWGFFVFLLYSMRRVDCRRCGVVAVEEVPWGDGKRTLTKAYMLFLARWARRLSWKETAGAFRTSWDKVFDQSNMLSHGVWNTGRSARSRRHPFALGRQRENNRVLSRDSSPQ